MSIIGTRVVRIEDPVLLTSGGTYTDDLVDERLTGAVWMTVVRSPQAHAHVGTIDTSAARAMPGVIGVVTAGDLSDLPLQGPTIPLYPSEMTMPLLATSTVRYVGEAVAVVVSERADQGEDAASLVDIEYQPLEVVVDPRAALEGNVLLFPALGTNVALRGPLDFAAIGDAATETDATDADATGMTGIEPSAQSLPDDSGDIFSNCAVVVSREILNQRVATAPIENRAAAATWSDGRLLMWCTNQGAQLLVPPLAAALGVEPECIHLLTADVGGGFGGKGDLAPEYVLAAWASRRFGRPVRWAETRSENLLSMHGRGQIQTVTVGGSRDGRVEAYRLEILGDAGAYPRVGAFLPPIVTPMMAVGVYTIDRVEVSGVSVVTNTGPMIAIRGAGRPEATAAIERAIDLFAAEIEMDPVEVRRRNLIPPFTEPYMTPVGTEYDTGDYQGALDLVLDAAGYAELRQEQAERRRRGDVVQLGIGLSVYVEITGLQMNPGSFTENATLEVHGDGTATILTGNSPHGQGHATTFAMLASDLLGIPIENFRLRHGDTDLIPEGAGTGASRSLQQGGAAVRQAAVDLIDLAKQRASSLFEVDPEDLDVDVACAGLTARGVPSIHVTFAELASKEALRAHSYASATGPTFPFGAHVAVVEVDTEVGKTTLRRLVAVDDAGMLVNPLIVEGQIHGGLATGAGQALSEEIVFDDEGMPLTSTFADYSIVSAAELPTFDLVEMQTPTPRNVLGAKGIGESGTVGSVPAVQNAVVDALAHLGVRHIDLPTSPQRVWSAIQTARESGD